MWGKLMRELLPTLHTASGELVESCYSMSQAEGWLRVVVTQRE